MNPAESDNLKDMTVEKNIYDNIKSPGPIEKLSANADVFKKKLDTIDFGIINVFEEKKIIDELRSECRGLTLPEIILYYNIFKIDAVMEKKKTNPAYRDKNNFPEKILRKVEENLFLTFDIMFKLNGNRTIHKEIIMKILEEKDFTDKINPDILLFLFEERNRKLVDKMKMFLENLAERRGDDPVEIFNYLGIYIILNDAPVDLFRHLQLSPQLKCFINGNPEEIKQHEMPVKEIYHQAVIYIFSFIYEIAGFVYKISGKYSISGGEQKSRLAKLITPERIRLFIENAHELSVKKLLTYHADIKEILPKLKKFLRTNRNILKSDDLFYKESKKNIS